MVKKLFKHEFLYYARVMCIVYAVLLTVATAGRVIQFFESESISYEIVSTVSFLTYGVSVFAAMAFAYVLAVIRFYRNLFTTEGYLSFTLPVTASEHILVKAVTAVCVVFITLVVILLSGCIITAGEVLSEIWKAVSYVLAKTYELMGLHTVVLGAECLLLFAVGLLTAIMLYYTFITIGQLFKKNRILAAVGAYFVYYILMQILSTILMVTLTVAAASGALEGIVTWLTAQMELHPFVIMHAGLWILILLSAVFGLVEYFVIKNIITKKLNLE